MNCFFGVNPKVVFNTGLRELEGILDILSDPELKFTSKINHQKLQVLLTAQYLNRLIDSIVWDLYKEYKSYYHKIIHAEDSDRQAMAKVNYEKGTVIYDDFITIVLDIMGKNIEGLSKNFFAFV